MKGKWQEGTNHTPHRGSTQGESGSKEAHAPPPIIPGTTEMSQLQTTPMQAKVHTNIDIQQQEEATTKTHVTTQGHGVLTTRVRLLRRHSIHVLTDGLQVVEGLTQLGVFVRAGQRQTITNVINMHGAIRIANGHAGAALMPPEAVKSNVVALDSDPGEGYFHVSVQVPKIQLARAINRGKQSRVHGRPLDIINVIVEIIKNVESHVVL